MYWYVENDRGEHFNRRFKTKKEAADWIWSQELDFSTLVLYTIHKGGN